MELNTVVRSRQSQFTSYEQRTQVSGAEKFCGILIFAVSFFALILVGATTTLAQTPTLPGNGKIAFTSDRDGNREIYVMNSDGTNQVRLTNNLNVDDYPAWSSDGTKIAYLGEAPSGHHAIKIMNADGSGQRIVTPIVFDLSTRNFCGERFSLSWSPDSSRIAFQEFGHIVAVNVDGTNRQNITNSSVRESEPSWARTGLIAYSSTLSGGDGVNGLDIRTTDGSTYAHYGYFTCSTSPALSLDGTKLVYVHSNDFPPPGYIEGLHPDRQFNGVMNVRWSPDGNYLVFTSLQYPQLNIEIVDQFGQDRRWLTQGSNPSWQPLLSATCPNPIDCADFFVRQQYLDFLGREPDTIGLQNWVNTLVNCPNGGYGEFDNPHCDRVHVSAGFYQSEEFQARGFWAHRFYEVGFDRRPTYAEFIPDMLRVGGPQSPQSETASKSAYTNDFVLKQEFRTRYDSLSNAAYLNALEQNAEVILANKQALLDALNASTKTRAAVLREVIESPTVSNRFFNRAFVSMQYFGYLRRDPDTVGFQNWVNTLDADPNNFRHMIFGFIYSTEYRQRFGQP